jgi:hypothetical protein
VLLLVLSGDINLNPGPPCTINIAHLNTRSISSISENLNKPALLQEFILDQDIEILSTSETWLSTETPPSILNSFTPANFSLIHNPRPNGKGGGVAFIFRSYLKATRVPLPTFPSFESLCIRFSVSSVSYTFLTIYRPPSSSLSNFLSDFSSLLDGLVTSPSELIVTGDFNIHADCPTNPSTSAFLDILDSYSLTQHVDFPTHTHGHTIDLILTRSNSTILSKVEFTIPFISDHYATHATVTIPISKRLPQITRHVRAFRSINIDSFASDILTSELYTAPATSLQQYLNVFTSTISSLIDKHAPLKTITCNSKPQKPFITPHILSEKAKRSKLETIYRRSRSPADLLNYKTQSRNLSKLITSARRSYFRSVISNHRNQPRKLWSALSSLLSRDIPPSLPSSLSSSTLATSFLQFFEDKISKLCSAFTPNTLSHTSPHLNPTSPPPLLCNLSSASPDEVKHAILASSDSTCNLDEIPTKLLKSCIDSLLTPITTLVNLSLAEGSFPSHYKHALVKPLLKKYNLPTEDLSSYRPISNLNFISKLLERIIHSRLISHLNSFTSIATFQSAYRPSHSTETALLRIQNDLLLAINEHKVSALILLDLSAAFDTIDHKILLERLSSFYGISGSALDLLSSYLSNRTQSVSINSCSTSPSPVPTGVPQGSVLGPLLFTLYTSPISQLFKNSSVNYHLYADDTQLYISFLPSDAESSLSIISSILNSVHTWLTNNRLTVNPSKTEYLLIGTPQQRSKVTNSSVSFCGNVLIDSMSCRNLGVIFDNQLSLKKHVSSVCQTSYLQIRQLRQIRSSLDINSATILANSLVSSRLDYCNSLFHALPDSTISRLQRIQNCLARVVLPYIKRSDHISPALKKLHWLPVKQRIIFKLATITYKTLHIKQPSYLLDLLQYHNPSRSLRSASQHLLTIPRIDSANGRRSFSFSAPSIWNSLPLPIRLSPTLSTFRSSIKTHLFPP